MFKICTAFFLGVMAVYTTVAHPFIRLLLAAMLAGGAYIGWARRAVNYADSRRSRRSVWRPWLALALLLVGACRPAPTRPPEPAQVTDLACGGRSCSITDAAGVTVIWVEE